MYSYSSDTPTVLPGSSQSQDPDSFTDPARILSREECEALFHRIVGLTSGRGQTSVTIRVSSLSHFRWARNAPTTSGIIRSNRVIIRRVMGETDAYTEINKLDDTTIKQALAKAESRLNGGTDGPDSLPSAQKYLNAPIWSDASFNMTKQACSDAARKSADIVMDAKMFAAGYLETRAATWAIFNTKGLIAYAAGTSAQYSETVRNPEGTGSGWAGLSQNDWSKLDLTHLSTRALQKCLDSINPRAIEPGRYTVIMEPEATGKLMGFATVLMDRPDAEQGKKYSPYGGEGKSRMGERIMDERITITTNPTDPDCPFIPFDGDGYPHQSVTWIENGVLKALAYDMDYAVKKLGTDTPLPNPDAFHMSGGNTSMEEMIATTDRGVLVTRFGLGTIVDIPSCLVSTFTRDGMWLIEKGKIKFPIKNMRVLESPLRLANNVIQLGKPERVFGNVWLSRGPQDLDNYTAEALGNVPHVAPPMKVRDFNFIALVDAV